MCSQKWPTCLYITPEVVRRAYGPSVTCGRAQACFFSNSILVGIRSSEVRFARLRCFFLLCLVETHLG